MMDTTSTDASSPKAQLAHTLALTVQELMIDLPPTSPEADNESQICDDISELSINDLFGPIETAKLHEEATDEVIEEGSSTDGELILAIEPVPEPVIPSEPILLPNTLSRSEHTSQRPIYFNLALSGGSVKGISHVGALKVLEERGLIDLKQLKSIAGTSAGSLLGMLIVLGFSLDDIWQFLYELDITKLMDPNPLLFLQRCGVESGQILHNFFEKILTQSTNIKHINFRQLYELTGIHYTVVGSCLTTKEAVYYDYLNTPNFKVSMAVRISISMPGFFTPVSIGDRKYIDGAILDDYPMGLFADRLDETVGIMITNEFNTEYQYPEEYFRAVLNLFMYKHFYKAAEKWSSNTIFVAKSAPGVNLFSFDIDQVTKKQLYQNGFDAAIEFCNTHHPV